MSRFFELRQRLIPLPAQSCWLLALLLWLGLPQATWAGPTPQQLAQYQRRLRAVKSDYRYWDASHDSLRRARAGRRAPTQRQQTLQHQADHTHH